MRLAGERRGVGCWTRYSAVLLVAASMPYFTLLCYSVDQCCYALCQGRPTAHTTSILHMTDSCDCHRIREFRIKGSVREHFYNKYMFPLGKCVTHVLCSLGSLHLYRRWIIPIKRSLSKFIKNAHWLKGGMMSVFWNIKKN